MKLTFYFHKQQWLVNLKIYQASGQPTWVLKSNWLHQNDSWQATKVAQIHHYRPNFPAFDYWMVFVFHSWETIYSLSASPVNRSLIPIVNPGHTKALNVGVAFSSVILFLHCKLNKKGPFVFSSWPGFVSNTIQGVRVGSCPDCRGPSQKSWCLSLNRHHCGCPPQGFSPVFVCGLHWGEPAGPDSQNDHASHQMDPSSETEEQDHYQRSGVDLEMNTLQSLSYGMCI